MRAQAHVANLIQKQGAAIGFLEFADLVLGGAGEAAFDMAKKFGLDELFGDSRAIHFYERAFGAKTGGMQGAGH